MKLILGSQSPRRKELLQKAGFNFVVKVSDVDENVEYNSIEEMSIKISNKKAKKILEDNPNDIVIAADTIVVLDNKVLGKPKTKEEAFDMIKSLQGRKHQVMTSVVILSKRIHKEMLEVTNVNVSSMTDEEINKYINTKEPYDKAGGYGIQGIFGKFVRGIEGDYYNVMGLPINRVYQYLKNMNI